MPINVLPIHLINKIAAGEVIERPASIVKELVENALDAGAAKIDVTVEEGGRKLIAVTDDGCGMDQADAALAFAAHATSKIADDDDLFGIATLGFRGEALASIASVSHAHIRTRRGADEAGCQVEASGEQIGRPRPCPAAPGTTVTVRDLFFNTPARRKFLRKPTTEFAHINEQLARLALPHPQVAFTLKHNGRKIQDLPPVDSTRRRIVDLFGLEVGESLLTVSGRADKVSISGLIGSPGGARGSGKWQYLFLNGRYVRSRLLAHALREAHRGRIGPDRFPVAFLFIEVDPGEVDVNVHPTKIEVRFRDTQTVHGELLAALTETLNKAGAAPVAEASPFVPSCETHVDEDARRDRIRHAMADFFKSAPPPQPRLSFPEHPPSTSARPAQQALGVYQAPDQAEPSPSPAPRALQVHNTYLVTATDDGLIIVDQHALHERLIYNDLKRRLADGKLTGQRLLIPETLTVTPAEADTVLSRSRMLQRLGIEIELFGPRTLAVQQFPALLVERGISAATFTREMIDQLAEDDTADAERVLEEVLSMLACKAAVKAGDPLSRQEIDALLARAASAAKASSCPHGRPSTLKLSIKDLEKQFQRT